MGEESLADPASDGARCRSRWFPACGPKPERNAEAQLVDKAGHPDAPVLGIGLLHQLLKDIVADRTDQLSVTDALAQ